MFDIGADELLMVAVVAIVVIGPKDLPRALRTAGQWIAKMRRMSGHFRSGIDAMIREAELAEMERKWREHNAAIMAQTEQGQTPAAASDQVITQAPATVPSLSDQPAGEAPPP